MSSRTAAWVLATSAIAAAGCASLVGADFDREPAADYSVRAKDGPDGSPPSVHRTPPPDAGDAGGDAGTVTCYRDEDNDGYGLPDDVQLFAGRCPDGWTTAAGDCDDASEAAHPGVTDFFPEPHHTSFDYDCDGKISASLSIPSAPNTPVGVSCSSTTDQDVCDHLIIVRLECGLETSTTTGCAWLDGSCKRVALDTEHSYTVSCR